MLLPLIASCVHYVPVPNDPSLTRPCDNPQLKGNTYRDIVTLAVKRGQSLEDCSSRMKALR